MTPLVSISQALHTSHHQVLQAIRLGAHALEDQTPLNTNPESSWSILGREQWKAS